VGTLLFGAAGAVFYAKRIEPHWLELTHRELALEDLPPHLEGRTLIHLSDLHVGPQVEDEYVIRTLRRAARLRPDFVVVTGDWISYRDDREIQQLDRVLRALPRGSLGTLGILGNHDYGPNWSSERVGDAVCAVARHHGVTMLRDEVVSVAGLVFVGIEDFWGPRFDPAAALGVLDGRTSALCLCHNPDVADEPVWGGFRGWILSGHTHGGQCKPPFLPPPILPVRNKRYTAGVFGLDDRRTLFINRGVGHLLQARFNVRPEVSVFRLTGAGG
jgi:predicted MPP superfamily phosphohydrolase